MSRNGNERIPLLSGGEPISLEEIRTFVLAEVTGAPSGAAGGDLGGTYPDPTVTSLGNVTASSHTLFGNAGTVDGATISAIQVSTGLSLSTKGGDKLTADWAYGPVSAVSAGISLSSGTLTVAWQAATVTTIGAGLVLNAGTLDIA